MVLALVFSSFLLVDPALNWQNEKTITHAFDQIALRSEYRPGRSFPVRKWLQPIRVFIDQRAGLKKTNSALVKNALTQLHQETGHAIDLTPSAEKANMIVLFAHSEQMPSALLTYFKRPRFSSKFLNENLCFAHLRIRPSGEITQAFIGIPVDRAMERGRLPDCVIEETTQSLGLVNDSTEVYPSIFNDKSINRSLTGLDRMLLRLLYSPQIKPGMNRKTALPIVKNLTKKYLDN